MYSKSLSKLQEEIIDYINLKIPMVDEVIRKELVINIMNLVMVRENDLMTERDDQWRGVMNRRVYKGSTGLTDYLNDVGVDTNKEMKVKK